MKCEEALLLISGHIDGENTREEGLLLEAHLKDCDACRQILQSFLEVDAGLAAYNVDAPEDLCGKVMSAVASENKPVKKHKVWPILAVAAAAALVIGLQADMLPLFRPEQEAVPMVARSAPAPVAYTEMDFFEEISGQVLSEVRRANVVETAEVLPETESCTCEQLEDGSVLYLLPEAESAVELSEKYGLEVFLHPQAEESYALLTVK